MKVTLRKANAIQQLLAEIISKVSIVNHATFSEFSDAADTLDQARNAFEEALNKSEKLIAAQYSIRQLVAEANATSGINAKLTDAARIQRMLDMLEKASVLMFPRMSISEIQARIEKSKQTPGNFGYTSQQFSSLILTDDAQTEIATRISSYKKEKLKLSDSILETNIRTEIVLSDEIVAVLKEEDLL